MTRDRLLQSYSVVSVCVCDCASVFVSVGHDHEPCKIGTSDREVVLVRIHGAKEPDIK